MKRVYEHIEQRSVAFARQPLFELLRDETVAASRRLSFVPFMTHFVMTFADLYNHVLTESSPRDQYDALVNTHLAEDATHWKWFLADLASADLDPQMRFSDALRFVWSDATVQTRLLSYRICQLSGRASSLQKFVIVSCIEATGKVGLGALAVAGGALERAIGRKLVYFGPHHVETESSHTVEAPSVRQSIEDVSLTDGESQALRVLADEIFGLFEGSVEELNRVASSGHGFDDFAKARRAATRDVSRS
jgi:hypothetical protein